MSPWWVLSFCRELAGSGKKCQGTTSVVPKMQQTETGLQPLGKFASRHCIPSAAKAVAGRGDYCAG